MSNLPNDNRNDYKKYQKKSFFRRLPFGVKASFIKYWFYGAVYFFCFMGLGNVIKGSEDLILVTGLIAGVFFDIALYNIYILIAETRKEASKWWIYKSKKFYSIFINVAILIGVFFIFHFIVVPIKAAMPGRAVWLFQEPLSAALLLTIIDTAIVWIKNLLIQLFERLFKKEQIKENKNESYIRIVDITPISVSVELNNNDAYFINKPFNVLLDNEIIFKKIKTNSLTIFDLKPDTQYKLAINQHNIVFTTPKIYKVYKVYEGNDIQNVIDMADQYSLIIINKGTYNIKSLILKNNLVLYLRKGATLLASYNEEDYPVLPPYNNEQNEIYGNYKGEAKKMRTPIIHIDHLQNVKIVGEGVIDGQANLNSNYQKKEFEIAPPHLIFINHSSNISLIGLSLKNSPQWSVHPFFSSDVNLLNLEIVNNNDSMVVDGITPQCSSSINIIGCHFAYLDNCVAIKSGKSEIAIKQQASSRKIAIRNCYMEKATSAVTLGNECSSGINSINISRSRFIDVKNGLTIKSRRGNGKNAIIRDISVDNVKIENAKTPFILDMFCKEDLIDDIDRILNQKFTPIDNDTPYFNNFIFKNIEVKNFTDTAGYFLGLPEKYIYEIKIIDSLFSAKKDSDGNKKGFMIKNVRSISLKNVKIENIVDKRLNIENVSEVIDDN